MKLAREYATIVLHIEKKRAKEFERLFEGDELKRWDDYTARGRFVEARLIRCRYSALQRQLGLKRYETAWMMLHKLRRATVAPQRSPLIGVIEVDDTYIGGTDSVRRGGRDAFGAATIVIIAVEVRGNGSGRIRMKAVDDLSADALCGFVRDLRARGGDRDDRCLARLQKAVSALGTTTSRQACEGKGWWARMPPSHCLTFTG